MFTSLLYGNVWHLTVFAAILMENLYDLLKLFEVFQTYIAFQTAISFDI